jgi:dTDP-L-rhamnose 4-epimerase
MKILLIGGAGFIGSHTALRLAQEGHSPCVLDSLDPQIHGSDPQGSGSLRSLLSRIPVQVGDTRDAAALDKALAEVEAVYYFPAGTGTGQSMYQIERYTDINARGAAVFCEALARRGKKIRRVIVSSTRAVYGEGAAICNEHGRVFPNGRKAADLERGNFDSFCPLCGRVVVPAASLEEDPFKPVSVYGVTKLTQEQLIAGTCSSLGIPAVIFRYQNVYGPGQSLNNSYTGILSIFAQLLLAGREINLFEDGKPSRDFVFIDDVVEYNVRALVASPKESHILNVGSGERVTLVDLVSALGAAMGAQPRYFVSGQFRVGDIRHALADRTALISVLGGHSCVSLQEGVKFFLDWVVREGVSQDSNERFQRSLEEMRQAGLLRGKAQ